MTDIELNILSTKLLDAYLQQVDVSLFQKFEQLKESELSADTFSFYTSVSAVFSSKIRLLGLEYDKLDYLQALSFLLMLPKALG